MERLREELRNTRENHKGRLVCITGEAGLGKTTVAENLLSELSDQDVTIARGRCSERLAGAEAYLPLLEALESLLRGPSGTVVSMLMARTAPTWSAQLGPRFEFTGEGGLDGSISQERLKREITRFVEHLTRDQPLVLFLEDLHWADVSTIDILTYVADRFDDIPISVLVTYRPEDMRLIEHAFLQVRPTLEQRGLLTEVVLGFLSREDLERYLALEFPGERLFGDLAAQIHDRTEGSPLFVVDIVRDLRSRGVVSQRDGRWTVNKSSEEIGRELPGSIRSLIERKVGRLEAEEQTILLAASVQGEEFDAAIVARALDADPAELEESLEPIERAHSFVVRVGERELPDGTLTLRYRFAHVLYQNTLYASIGPSKRVSLCLAVAQALESSYRDEGARVAAELALLYEAAREPERAWRFFVEAAQHANRVFAHHEVAHLAGRGLEVLAAIDENSERTRAELALRTVLSPAIMAIHGWASPEAKENTHRSEQLCRQVGDDRDVFSMLCGSLAVHLVQGTPAQAQPMGDELLEIADRLRDPARLLAAHSAYGDTLFLLGELAEAREHQKKGVEIWASQEWDSLPAFFAQHPVITCLGSGSWTLAWMGFPDQALSEARKAVELASELSHPFAIHAFDYLAHVHEMRGEWSAAGRAADTLEAAHDEGHAFFDAAVLLIRGRILAANGYGATGLAMMQDAVAEHDAGGFLLFRTRNSVWIAEALTQTGRARDGLDLMEQCLADMDRDGVRTYLAELHRTRGDLILTARHDPVAAEVSYRKALETAREQEARLFEVRAANGLGRLLHHEGRRTEAIDVLQTTYGWFTEGLDTPELLEARQLLETLT